VKFQVTEALMANNSIFVYY